MEEYIGKEVIIKISSPEHSYLRGSGGVIKKVEHDTETEYPYREYIYTINFDGDEETYYRNEFYVVGVDKFDFLEVDRLTINVPVPPQINVEDILTIIRIGVDRCSIYPELKNAQDHLHEWLNELASKERERDEGKN